jgi:hypothetical protein
MREVETMKQDTDCRFACASSQCPLRKMAYLHGRGSCTSKREQNARFFLVFGPASKHDGRAQKRYFCGCLTLFNFLFKNGI